MGYSQSHPLEAAGRWRVRQVSPRALFREIAEELALRSGLACFAYPALILVAAILVPVADRRIPGTLTCAFAALLIVSGRALLARRFGRLYALSPKRWLGLFRARVYGSTGVWALFALSVMSTRGDSRPKWITARHAVRDSPQARL